MKLSQPSSYRPTAPGRLCAVTVLLAFSPGLAWAQAVAPASTPPANAAKEDVIALTPFEVRAALDTGYMGFETASGSRLNTRLSDTPASISVFTAEFLNDIAATNVADVAKYASN